MITDTFDNLSESKINPDLTKKRIKVDACIITFSNIIEDYIINKYHPEVIGKYETVNGVQPIYKIKEGEYNFAFYKTILSAPMAVACLEDSRIVIDTDKYICFGGSGCLNKEYARGKIIVPTYAYRDEGTSYHYKAKSDYIDIKNSNIVAKFFDNEDIPFAIGKTWTTDAFYRETERNFEKRKEDGCISVEMECSAMQAVCDFRNIELFYFLSCGDLLDCPKWDKRNPQNGYEGTQHDVRLVNLAIDLAKFILEEKE